MFNEKLRSIMAVKTRISNLLFHFVYTIHTIEVCSMCEHYKHEFPCSELLKTIRKGKTSKCCNKLIVG